MREFDISGFKMEIKYRKNVIDVKKEINSLDKLALRFVSILDKLNMTYSQNESS